MALFSVHDVSGSQDAEQALNHAAEYRSVARHIADVDCWAKPETLYRKWRHRATDTPQLCLNNISEHVTVFEPVYSKAAVRCTICGGERNLLLFYLFICFRPQKSIETQPTRVTTEKHKTTHKRLKLHKQPHNMHCIQHIVTVLQHWNTFTTLLCKTMSFLYCAALCHNLVVQEQTACLLHCRISYSPNAFIHLK